MRKINLLLLLFSFFLLNSCCHLKYCDEKIGSIALRNFTEQEIDTILLRSYQKNSNFTVLVDSFYDSGIDSSYSPPKLHIRLRSGFNYDLEYKVDVIQAKKTYLLTGFTEKKEECNSCFPWGHTYYSLLDKYDVNGTEKYSEGFEALVIEK